MGMTRSNRMMDISPGYFSFLLSSRDWIVVNSILLKVALLLRLPVLTLPIKPWLIQLLTLASENSRKASRCEILSLIRPNLLSAISAPMAADSIRIFFSSRILINVMLLEDFGNSTMSGADV